MSLPGQLDLFSATPSPSSDEPTIPGLIYEAEFLSPDEEKVLLSRINAERWITDLRRRVQHYGWRYDYKARRIDPGMYLGKLPEWLDDVSARLLARGWFDQLPDQVIVNEYLPGQGIAAHTDCVPCFGPTLASVSLLSDVLMDFENPRTKERHSRRLERRSIAVLQGDARYLWRHGISARLKDIYQSKNWIRSRRVSLTFRTVIL